MPRASIFTDADNAAIVRMRAAGCSWKVVAAALGHGPEGVRDHAHRRNLVPRQTRPTSSPTPVYVPAFSHGRGYDIMPPFHPTSWGAIWDGLETRP